tara:strand:+ start:998 stop:1504 length:507 start_codon:yes stop_codon:yes gene_type:complete
MARQTTHDEVPFSVRSSGIHLLCDGVKSPANVGGLFRLAEAFGVCHLYFCDAQINFNSERLKRTARGTMGTVPYSSEVASLEIINSFKEKATPIYALEITTTSIPLQQLPVLDHQEVVLIVGNEQHGVSKPVLSLVDNCFHINMLGANSSMNVTQAAAIALYALTKDL